MKTTRRRFDASQLRITRGALIIAGLELGLSLVYLVSNVEARTMIEQYVAASPGALFEHYRVWTLVTSPLLQNDFLALLLDLVMLWMIVPTLERFWGTDRFYRFVAVTSVVGVAAGCLMGLLTGRDVPIVGLSPFIYASIVAFGVIYARQPVQFAGVLPLSGRQLMYGIIAFVTLWVVLQQEWEHGAAFAAAMIAAAVMTSKRWSPGLAWRRWRIARARARLAVIEGGKASRPKRDEQRWLN